MELIGYRISSDYCTAFSQHRRENFHINVLTQFDDEAITCEKRFLSSTKHT